MDDGPGKSSSDEGIFSLDFARQAEKAQVIREIFSFDFARQAEKVQVVREKLSFDRGKPGRH